MCAFTKPADFEFSREEVLWLAEQQVHGMTSCEDNSREPVSEDRMSPCAEFPPGHLAPRHNVNVPPHRHAGQSAQGSNEYVIMTACHNKLEKAEASPSLEQQLQAVA